MSQNDAIGRGAFDEVARLWTEDITIRASLGLSLTGRAAYRAAFTRDTTIVYIRQTTSVQLSDAWPLAWEEGTWIGRRRSTGERMISGRYAAQWVKMGETWRIRSELFVALECSGVACQWPVAQ